MPTTLEQELAEQSRWPFLKGATDQKTYELLVRAEFVPPDAIRGAQDKMLRTVVTQSAAKAPYYAALFKRLGIDPADFRGAADLPRLPILTRADLQEAGDDLMHAEAAAHKNDFVASQTSGSTGTPVAVRRTFETWKLFAMLKQRELRWFRYDPAGTMAAIRAAVDLPPINPGEPIKIGETARLDRWPQIGYWFETGPFFGFGNRNPQEAQADWLREIDPEYLLMQSAELEQLALAFQDKPRPKNLKACQGVSQQMTAEMRNRIERILGVPVHENYGLNEVSLVASRCPEGGLFHIHAENCLVEIVDDDLRPCRPGDRGRILVTSLSNGVMPLLRYDADDLAIAVDEPCPCGRTLPALTGLIGRYRRNALLPPETWSYWIMFQYSLMQMPDELRRPLRQYQLHQFRDNRFELRVVAASPLADAFKSHIYEYWQKGGEGEPPHLEIIEVDSIPRPRGGKFQNFTSDFAPVPKAEDLDSGPSPLAFTGPAENA